MTLAGITFLTPWVLAGLLALPVIWWLLRLTPPKPKSEVFPPTRILLQVAPKEETPAKSPWWLTLLRLLMAAAVIFAMADPVLNSSQTSQSVDGPTLLIVDNSWSTATDWPLRQAAINKAVDEAERAGQGVMVAASVQSGDRVLGVLPAGEARTIAAAIRAQPVKASWGDLANSINGLVIKPGKVVFLASPLKSEGLDELTSALQSLGADVAEIYQTPNASLGGLQDVRNDTDAMYVTVSRLPAAPAQSELVAYDIQGRTLARGELTFEDGAVTGEAKFEVPVELRNEVTRIDWPNQAHAGAVRLLDESHGRKRIGLISGTNADRSQPLLAPLYYISRALLPFAEVREPSEATIGASIEQLIEDRASVIVLADIGSLPDDVTDRLDEWVKKGGMLLRFAGPRLAGATFDPLAPVELRRGGRDLSGSLTWEEPQKLAPFGDRSPFRGLEVPDEVTVRRQVLAEPDIDLENKTWAQLQDGTPLVTAEGRGDGTIILFHVSADAEWSNLPLSGVFVDMLRRIVFLASSATGALDNQRLAATDRTAESVLPPWRILDGNGRLTQPQSETEPLKISRTELPTVSRINPPGLYGQAEGFVALNLLDKEDQLLAFEAAAFLPDAIVQSYLPPESFDIKPWLLILALTLLALDCLAVLWMGGAFRRRHIASAVRVIAFVLAISMSVLSSGDGFAQSEEIPDFQAALQTRLAYVITGDSELDSISRKGLRGLTAFLASRTSLEPGEPVSVDISSDELAFYPILYWPVSETAVIPDSKTMARIDAYMKRGGSVLFDTRDQLSGGFEASAPTPATLKLREILAGLDIPALEPVPENHVLTRAFYLLDVFPGRYLDGRLWVEATINDRDSGRPARSGDGVSSIMITSNDLAGAWAIEPSGQPSLPIIPPNATQRIYAYRTGVNIIMYTLTGNYKADQVHVPALLERLGQ